MKDRNKMFFFRNRGFTPSLRIQRMHTTFFIRKNTKALQDYNKDQISEATILAALAIPRKLMKGVTMDKAHCPGLAPTHIIEKPEASPNRPIASREHQLVQQTLSTHQHTCSLKSLPPFSSDSSSEQESMH
jgi:hypothetical protein